jgi:hypothetical protein
MQNKDIFKELIKKLDRQKKGLSDPRIMHPEREWAIGLGAMVVVFLLSAYWSSQMYLKNRDVTSVELSSDETVTYREAIVRDVLQRFQGRKNTYSQLTGDTRTTQETPIEVATTTPQAVEVTTPSFSTSSSTVDTEGRTVEEGLRVE